VALTFDDGPHPQHTSNLLEILDKENVHATFFMLGARVEYYKDITKTAYEKGHQVASHTYNHKDLTRISDATRLDEINNTISVFKNTLGVSPTMMRPPYGAFNDAVKQEANMPLALWSVDTRDWESRNADKVYNQAISNVRDGSIILMHDIYGSTVQAAARIISELKRQGYTLVTVEQLVLARGGTLEPGRVYYSMYK
jgi:peptidoglycan/xylan/chitin deacetylase (PgdA/CDA1 family)